tara:strand:+ start:365 stop:544 length:180 start_codon:yes stop_codon:yes gene_type:complete
MKVNKSGLIIICILLLVSIILLTSKTFGVETIRDVFITPAFIFSLYLIFKNFKKKDEKN